MILSRLRMAHCHSSSVWSEVAEEANVRITDFYMGETVGDSQGDWVGSSEVFPPLLKVGHCVL